MLLLIGHRIVGASAFYVGRFVLAGARLEQAMATYGPDRHRSTTTPGLASFLHYNLGYSDDETCRLEPIAKPVGPKIYTVTHVTGLTRSRRSSLARPAEAPL